MPMHSLRSATRCGGTGVLIPTVPDGVGDGLVLTMVGADIIPATGVDITVDGTVAAIGAVIGGITTTTGIIPDGVAVDAIGPIIVIRTVVRMETIAVIHQILPVELILLIEVLSLVAAR